MARIADLQNLKALREHAAELRRDAISWPEQPKAWATSVADGLDDLDAACKRHTARILPTSALDLLFLLVAIAAGSVIWPLSRLTTGSEAELQRWMLIVFAVGLAGLFAALGQLLLSRLSSWEAERATLT